MPLLSFADAQIVHSQSHKDFSSCLTLAHLPAWHSLKLPEPRTGLKATWAGLGTTSSAAPPRAGTARPRRQNWRSPRRVMINTDTWEARGWAARGQGRPQSQDVSRGTRRNPPQPTYPLGDPWPLYFLTQKTGHPALPLAFHCGYGPCRHPPLAVTGQGPGA